MTHLAKKEGIAPAYLNHEKSDKNCIHFSVIQLPATQLKINATTGDFLPPDHFYRLV